MSATTDCWKCFRSKWKATGRFDFNRNGRRRALLICEACGYAFSSGKPDAIAAAEAVADPDADMSAVIPQRSLPHTRIPQQGDHEMTRVGSMAVALDRDWKAKQAGDE